MHSYLGLNGSSLLGDGRSTSVNVKGSTAVNLLNKSLGLKLGEHLAGGTTVDLHAVHEDGSGDQFVGGNLLQELIHGRLVNDNRIVALLLDLSLGPLLLLGLSGGVGGLTSLSFSL